MAPRLLLGIDIGSSRIKTMLVDSDGQTVGMHAVGTPFRQTPAGVEMSVGDFFGAIGDALSGLRGGLESVVGVGIASMGETGTIIRAGKPSDLPLIAWHDDRGGETVVALLRKFGSDDLRTRTGRRPRPATTVAKLGWLAAQGADLRGVWLGVAGLVAWRLTGQCGQEVSLAATSGAFNPVSLQLEPDILATAGVSAVAWPAVLRAGLPVGVVHQLGAGWSGLPRGARVTIAGHDHLVGAVGSGATGADVVDSLGSGEPLLAAWGRHRGSRSLKAAFADDTGDLTITAWPGSGDLAVMWEGLRPGFALDHLARILKVDRARVERDAAAAPDIAPMSRSDLRALETGQSVTVRGDPGQTWAAALEGFAVAAADGEARLRAAGGSISPTLVNGGGVRSPRWIDAKRRRATHGIALAKEPEAVVRGAALLGGVAADWWTPEHMPPAMIELLSGAVMRDDR